MEVCQRWNMVISFKGVNSLISVFYKDKIIYVTIFYAEASFANRSTLAASDMAKLNKILMPLPFLRVSSNHTH